MPAQDRVRGDHATASQCPGQPPHERGQHGPVRPVHTWSWVGAVQDGDLVAQHEELDVLGGGRATRQQDQPEHLPKDVSTATAATPRDHVRPVITAGQRPRPDFWHPTGSRVDRWATAAVRVGPLLGHQAAVPAQHRGRGDQAMAAQLRRQVPDEGGE
jgi:hypothetical protein